MYVHCTYSWYNVRTLYVQCPMGTEPFFNMEDNIYLELNMGYKKCNSLSYSSPVGLLNISTFEVFDVCYNDGHLSK